MNSELEPFVRSIIDKKGLIGITAEVKEQLVSDLNEKLNDQINRAMISALPDDKVDQLNEMLDKGDDEEAIQRFITDSGIDVKQITLNTLVAFRNLYLGDKA